MFVKFLESELRGLLAVLEEIDEDYETSTQ